MPELEENSSNLVPVNTDIIGLPRRRYIKIKSMLKTLNGPTQQIKTQDLANVVKGRTDVPLPSWSKDAGFEKEIESLMKNDLCWVCIDCDSIVSFFSLGQNDNIGTFVRDAGIVTLREKSIKCPYCGSRHPCFLDPQFFWRGKKAPSKDTFDRVLSKPTLSAKKGRNPDNISTTPHEKLLEELMVEVSNTGSKEQNLEIVPIFDYQIKNLCRTVAESKKGKRSFYIPVEGEVTVERMRAILGFGFALRPTKGDVLGRVWGQVKEMIRIDFSCLLDVALGIAKRQGISAHSKYNQKTGGMAIALEYGLRDCLYSLDQLTYRICTNLITERLSKERLIFNIIGIIGETVRLHGPWPPVFDGYENEKEYKTIDLMADCQLQFVILHELWHILNYKRLTTHDGINRRSSGDNYLSRECSADTWAIDNILSAKEKFHNFGFQMLAIWWLFLYWHISECLLHKTLKSDSIALQRLKNIKFYLSKQEHKIKKPLYYGIPNDIQYTIEEVLKEYLQWLRKKED